MSTGDIVINYVLVVPNITFLNNYWVEQLLIQQFYERLAPIDRNIVDAAGGALVNKTLPYARESFNIMV